MEENLPLLKIGITQGDTNGIGYEVIMKALANSRILDLCVPIVYGVGKVAAFHKKTLGLNDFTMQVVKSVQQANSKKANLLNLSDEEVKVELGVATPTSGRMAELALKAACKDLKEKMIDAVVTAPINKSVMPEKSFNFSGHTEFLSDFFGAKDSLMMMVSENLRLGFVTNHLPIEQVAQNINKELIIKKIKILNQSLKTDFLCTNPKIAVLALNPHAGDNGKIGKEESEIIKLAIEQVFSEKINAFGPFPADGFFAAEQYRKFDAVLAMYHDQGMIPFKVLSMDGGVNFTAGLPIVRTSPAHGTAYDIAGQNIASCESFRNAIYLALDILHNRLSE
ncbi:MAG: 4-hydroxythreonine-4-phosphate dehydrogenase PdxA [Bacteroidales bacterium]|nr:4-hydroxythreonine-4-phosphate dehydrogenase PdxA [Bacteroidales bacterium]